MPEPSAVQVSAEGGFLEAPCCRSCLAKMIALRHVAPFACSNCRAVTDFTVAQIGMVHRELDRRLGLEVNFPTT